MEWIPLIRDEVIIVLTECYMDKKYFDILKKIEKETPFGCPLYYSPSGKIFAVDVLDQKTAIVLPVLR